MATLPWNPEPSSSEDDAIDTKQLEQIDTIVHLAGENVATSLFLGPLNFLGIQAWTEEKKKKIMDSRVISTRGLAEAIGKCSTPTTFLCASGTGVYGNDFFKNDDDNDKKMADETMDTSTQTGFLAKVSRQSEEATQPAKKKNNNNRIINLRFGVILSQKGGALAKLLPIFQVGGGGTLGWTGSQYFPFVSEQDAVRSIVHILSTKKNSLEGPVNVCSPRPCTNAEFTKALGVVLNRPTVIPFPDFAVGALFGEMGEEMLLGGTKAYPKRLLESGFEFRHEGVEDALRSAMEEDEI